MPFGKKKKDDGKKKKKGGDDDDVQFTNPMTQPDEDEATPAKKKAAPAEDDGGVPKWKPPKVDAFGTVEALFPDWGDVGISFSESGKDKLGRASVKSVKPGSKAPPEVCPGIVLISVHDERDGTRQTTGMSYEEQIKAIRNAGRPMKLTFQPPESAVPRGRLKPAVPGDVLVCLKPQVLRQGPEKGANQCRWSLQQGARVVVDQSFYDDKGVHRMKITDQDFHVKIFGAKISEFGGSRFIPAEVREKTQMVADTKFKHCGWVRQNDARSKFWKATQPADWGKEPEAEPEPEPEPVATSAASARWGGLSAALGPGAGGAEDPEARAARVAAAFAAAAGDTESAEILAIKGKLARVKASLKAHAEVAEEGVPPAEPDSDDSDDDGSSKLTKRQKQAADYKRMQEAEGEKIMAELKRKKERDALEEEVRVIERQLKTTARKETEQRAQLLMEEGKHKLEAKEFATAEKTFASALVLCSELDRTELQKLRREAKNKKAAEELAADGATYLKREDSTKALAKYKAAVKKDPKNAEYKEQLAVAEKLYEVQAPLRAAQAEEDARLQQLEAEEEQRLILIMKMERLLEAAKVKLEEAKSRRACRGAASLCSKALAMDEKEQFPERAEFDAVIRKAEQKGRAYKLGEQAEAELAKGHTTDAIVLFDRALAIERSDERLLDARNEAMFRASDEVHERKADGDRAGELSQEVEVAKAALDQVTRQVERDRARDNRPGVAKELEEAEARLKEAAAKLEEAEEAAEAAGVGDLFAAEEGAEEAQEDLEDAEEENEAAQEEVERLRARLVEIDATEQANVEAIEEKAAPLRKLEEELHPMVAKAEYHRKREEGKVEKATQKLQALQTKAEEQMDAKDYYGAVTTIAKALSARAFLEEEQVAELEAMEKRARELEALAADDEEEEDDEDEEYDDEDAE